MLIIKEFHNLLLYRCTTNNLVIIPESRVIPLLVYHLLNLTIKPHSSLTLFEQALKETSLLNVLIHTQVKQCRPSDDFLPLKNMHRLHEDRLHLWKAPFFR